MANSTERAERPTILVVEDHAAVRTVMRDALAKDFRVLAAASAREAAGIWAAHPDLRIALVDLSLPDTADAAHRVSVGFRLLEELHLRPRAILAVHTAYDLPANQREAIRRGAQEFISKDVQPADLLQRLLKLTADEPSPAPQPSDGIVTDWSDHDWVLTNPELLAQYAGRVVAVRDRQIYGSGKTPLDALAAATAELARLGDATDPADLVYVVVPFRLTDEE